MTGFSNGGKEKFAHFLSTNYHTVNDEIALPFDWQAGAKFARINYLIAREIAAADQAPRWYADDFFGDTFAPQANKVTAPSGPRPSSCHRQDSWPPNSHHYPPPG